MKVLKIYENSVNDRYISEAVEALRDGHIIIYPTDTVYAMAADSLNRRAVERLCHIRGLDPERNLLSMVCADLSQASDFVRIDNSAFGIIKNYLPGPFTFVLPSMTRLPKIFKGRKTIGMRVPDNNIARELARVLGNPLLSGSVPVDDGNPDSMTEPECLALTYANDVDIVIDGGTGGTEPSTVVDLVDPEGPVVIRQGAGNFDQ